MKVWERENDHTILYICMKLSSNKIIKMERKETVESVLLQNQQILKDRQKNT